MQVIIGVVTTMTFVFVARKILYIYLLRIFYLFDHLILNQYIIDTKIFVP